MSSPDDAQSFVLSRLDFGEATQDSKEVCGWVIGNVEIFADLSICDNPSDYFEFICYNAPEGGFNIFSS